MTTDLEQYQTSGAVAQIEASKTPHMSDLERQSMEMEWAYRIAESMCATELVPKSYRNKPYDGAAAIMFGRELGMNAIQSLQNVVVINGKPGIESRTMVALLKRQGYRFKTEENVGQNGASVTVTGMSPSGETETSTWDMEKAKKAGYSRNPLYAKTPTVMLYAKAAGEVCRRLAPDVLMGIGYNTEELQLGFGDNPPTQQPVKAQATVMPQQNQPQQQPQQALPANNNATPQQQQLMNAVFTQPQAQKQPEPAISEDAKLVTQEINSCTSQDELDTIAEWAQSVAQGNQQDSAAITNAWNAKQNSFNS